MPRASLDAAGPGPAWSAGGPLTAPVWLSRPRSAAGSWVWRRLDPVMLVAAVLSLVVTAGLARSGVFEWEVRVFRAVNDLPGALQPIVLVLNQYGTAATIPLVAAAVLLLRRWALAVPLAATGIGVYVLAKALKECVVRGRPASLIEGVIEREAFAPGSLGFPSGHVAAACAIRVLLLPRVGRPWQLIFLLLAIVVSFGGLDIAAHLPLDLLGGAALGVTAASAANLALGVSVTREDRDDAKCLPITGDQRGDRQ